MKELDEMDQLAVLWIAAQRVVGAYNDAHQVCCPRCEHEIVDTVYTTSPMGKPGLDEAIGALEELL